jgi:hypothetical protein
MDFRWNEWNIDHISKHGEAAIPPQNWMKRKAYWELTAKELADATKQFDEPFVIDQSRPLTPSERKQWNRAKTKRGRPKAGQGFKRVSLSIEQGLLHRATALAKKRRISRSKLFAEAIEQTLAENR